MIKNITDFLSEAKSYLALYFKKHINDKTLNLKDVYPINYKENNYLDINIDIFNLQTYLSELYENHIPLNIKKDLGQFYTTDEEIIEIMFKDVNVLKGKILEPSCGSGIFLVKIIQRIISELKNNNFSDEYILKYITENIYGNDCDENAISIAEINILIILLPLIINVKNKNANFKMNKLHLEKYDFTYKNIYDCKFSLIIGNPPYVTMYGKRSRNMTEEKRKYYNTFDFVQNKSGNNKFNLSMFFIENALKLLKENGRLIYILDISFLETAYIDIRKYIVENFYINSVIKGLSNFKNVASGQIIIDILNQKSYNKNINLVDYESGKKFEVNQLLWNNKKNKYKYFTPLNTLEQSINDKLFKFKTLDYYYPGKSLRTCCALTGKTEEFIVDPSKENKCLVFPYIEGSKGLKGKFFTPTPSRYIKYDYDLQIKLSNEFKIELESKGIKNKKRVTLGDKDTYLAPKIFIRQSALEIIATYCDKPFAANNSIYILSNKKQDIESINMLKYLCGILNSDLITFFCRINKIIRIEKGKTPQIKISDLKNVRICVNSQNYFKIIDIVNKLLTSPNNVGLTEELNSIVYNIYGINKKEITYINKFLKK